MLTLIRVIAIKGVDWRWMHGYDKGSNIVEGEKVGMTIRRKRWENKQPHNGAIKRGGDK